MNEVEINIKKNEIITFIKKELRKMNNCPYCDNIKCLCCFNIYIYILKHINFITSINDDKWIRFKHSIHYKRYDLLKELYKKMDKIDVPFTKSDFNFLNLLENPYFNILGSQ